MKCMLTFFCLMLFSLNYAKGQTATGTCTSVSVTSNPDYVNNLWGANVGYIQGNHNCERVITYGENWKPRYQLQRRNANGSYSNIGSVQYGNSSFTGVTHGTYRIRIENPRKDVSNPCLTGISCYALIDGAFLGYWGYWPSSQGVLAPYSYTNDVVVGNTVASDNNYMFINMTGDPNTFDYLQPVKLNTSGTQNYNLWWIAIFENSGLQRYVTTGWQKGTMPTIYNLTNLWRSAFPAGNFEVNTSYMVQFVTEDSLCINSPTWNSTDKTFFICPFGSGCRFGDERVENQDIRVNAQNNILTVFNLDFAKDRIYNVAIYSMDGKRLQMIQTRGETQFDISKLVDGLYMARIFEEREPIAVVKFVK